MTAGIAEGVTNGTSASRKSWEARKALLAVCATASLVVLTAGLLKIAGWDGRQTSPDAIGRQRDALLEAGTSQWREGRLDSARRMFEAALALAPDDPRALYDLGTVQQAQGNASGAVLSYQRALATSPQFTGAIFNLATIQGATHREPAAIKSYRRVLELQPNHASAMWNLGLLLYSNGSEAAGRRLLNRAIAIKPALRRRTPANVKLN